MQFSVKQKQATRIGQSDPREKAVNGKLLTKEGLYKHPDVGHYERRLVQVEVNVFLVDRNGAGAWSMDKRIGEKSVKLRIRK